MFSNKHNLEDGFLQKLSHYPQMLNYWRRPRVIYSADALPSVAFRDLGALADVRLESFLNHNLLPLSLRAAGTTCCHPQTFCVEELNRWRQKKGVKM